MTDAERAGLARALPAGSGWRVVLHTGADRIQYIGGFVSRQEAEEWIRFELPGWLKLLECGL